jgi:hypothetical protein
MDLENTSSFHCGTEVHLAKLHWLCLPIYLLALRVSHDSGKFVAHVQPLAEHFDSSRPVVWRAITDLKNSGFFVLTRSGHSDGIFESSEYEILTHKQWTAKHPNQCRTKFELGYEDKAATDLLGRHLYAISGGYQITFKNYRLAWYRKQKTLTDAEIEDEFRAWFPKHVAEQKQAGKKWRNRVDYHFGTHLVLVAAERRRSGAFAVA